MLLRNIPQIRSDLIDLNKRSIFKGFDLSIDDISWEMFPKGFAGLLRILIGQQVSLASADAMWMRVIKAAGSVHEVTPEFILEQSDESLKSMAFSRQKARYITALAYNTISGEFDADALDNLPDEKVYTKIISQLGFGPWSAHIYLLFTLGRADILPRNDLAIDKALTFVFNLNRKPDYNEALKLMEPFNGQRSAASLLLWQIYITRKL